MANKNKNSSNALPVVTTHYGSSFVTIVGTSVAGFDKFERGLVNSIKYIKKHYTSFMHYLTKVDNSKVMQHQTHTTETQFF